MRFQQLRRGALLGVVLATLTAPGVADVPRTCAHMGADWVDPKVVSIGAMQCPSIQFTITIGASLGGIQITVDYQGCPAYVDIIPGHGELVQKLQKNPTGPQVMNHLRQRYKAKCGIWGLFTSCRPDGDSQELNQYVHHWTEQACPVIVGPLEP
jgi:hypothetical protein